MSLVLGIGARTGVTSRELTELITRSGIDVSEVSAVVTVQTRASEPGLIALCAAHHWPLSSYPAAHLAAMNVPTPSGIVQALAGTGSVAEAAAATHGTLIVAKLTSPNATLAVARTA